MGDRVADAKALGYSAFAIIVWMSSMVSAGWYTPDTAVVNGVITFAALALLIVALASFLRGEAWHAVFFLLWWALIMGYKTSMETGMMGMSPYGAWYDITIALVSFLLFAAALRSSFGLPVVLLSIGVALAYLSSAIGGWAGGRFWMVLSGYIGLVTALAAFWAAASAFGRLGGGQRTTPAAGTGATGGGMGGGPAMP